MWLLGSIYGLFSYVGPAVMLLDIMSLGWDSDEKAVE